MNYKKPDNVSKNQTIEDWIVKSKIIKEMSNYCESENHKLTAKTSLIS